MKIRIGEFAQKHNVSQHTIRHYLDVGLLVTEKIGSHYRFTEEDHKDFEKIIQLKELGFSLSEIQKILGLQRLSGNEADHYREMYLSLLESKKEEVIAAKKRYEQLHKYLKSLIEDLKVDKENSIQNLGFPISSASLLQCPKCKSPLSISAGAIENNMLIEASIKSINPISSNSLSSS